MHACVLQCIAKMLLFCLLCSWVVHEAWIGKKSLKVISTLSRHIVSSDRWMKVIYGSLLVVCGVVFLLGYLVVPYQNLQWILRVLMGVLIVSLGLMFLDLFLNYNPTQNIYEQFRRYHNPVLPLIFGLMIVVILLSRPMLRHLRAPRRHPRLFSSLWFLGCGILIGLSILFVYLNYFHPRDRLAEDSSGCWYALVEAAALLLVILLFPIYCPRCFSLSDR